jgi:hypothetical protein
MMMKAIYNASLGGCVLFNPKLNEDAPSEDGYLPNKYGMWEVGISNYLNTKFLRAIPDGALIKIMFDGLVALPAGEYTIIFMTRDVSEINESAANVDKHLEYHAKNQGVPLLPHGDVTYMLPFCCLDPYDQSQIDHVLGIMRERRDVNLIMVDYGDVIADPKKEFTRLREHLEFDVDIAVSHVDPEQYRVRK